MYLTIEALHLKLQELYDLFQAPAIYTDADERQEVLDEIREVQEELKFRHRQKVLNGWQESQREAVG